MKFEEPSRVFKDQGANESAVYQEQSFMRNVSIFESRQNTRHQKTDSEIVPGRQKTYSFFDTHIEFSPEEREFSYLEKEETKDLGDPRVEFHKSFSNKQNDTYCEYDDNVSSEETSFSMNNHKIPRVLNFQKASDPAKLKPTTKGPCEVTSFRDIITTEIREKMIPEINEKSRRIVEQNKNLFRAGPHHERMYNYVEERKIKMKAKKHSANKENESFFQPQLLEQAEKRSTSKSPTYKMIRNPVYKEVLQKKKRQDERIVDNTPGKASALAKNTEYARSKTTKEFNQTIQDLEKVNHKQLTRLDYLQMCEIIRRMNCLSNTEASQRNYRSPCFVEERYLLSRAWDLLTKSGNREEVQQKDLLRLFLIIDRIDDEDFEAIAEEGSNKLSTVIAKSPAHRRGSSYVGNTGSNINSKKHERRKSLYDRSKKGTDQEGNELESTTNHRESWTLSSESRAEIQKTFEVFYRNRVACKNKQIEAYMKQKYQVKQKKFVNNSSEQMANKFKSKILHGRKNSDCLNHAEFLLLQKAIVEEKLQKVIMLRQEETMKECTFQPKTNKEYSKKHEIKTKFSEIPPPNVKVRSNSRSLMNQNEIVFTGHAPGLRNSRSEASFVSPKNKPIGEIHNMRGNFSSERKKMKNMRNEFKKKICEQRQSPVLRKDLETLENLKHYQDTLKTMDMKKDASEGRVQSSGRKHREKVDSELERRESEFNDQTQNKEICTEPVMIIDVLLDTDLTKTLSIYEGEDPESVAKSFACLNKINQAQERKLVELLKFHLANISLKSEE